MAWVKPILLGWVRDRGPGGYFFPELLMGELLEQRAALHGRRTDTPGPATETQLRRFVRGLAAAADMPTQVQHAVAGEMSVPPDALNIFVDAFRSRWPNLGAECHETHGAGAAGF